MYLKLEYNHRFLDKIPKAVFTKYLILILGLTSVSAKICRKNHQRLLYILLAMVHLFHLIISEYFLLIIHFVLFCLTFLMTIFIQTIIAWLLEHLVYRFHNYRIHQENIFGFSLYFQVTNFIVFINESRREILASSSKCIILWFHMRKG